MYGQTDSHPVGFFSFSLGVFARTLPCCRSTRNTMVEIRFWSCTLVHIYIDNPNIYVCKTIVSMLYVPTPEQTATYDRISGLAYTVPNPKALEM